MKRRAADFRRPARRRLSFWIWLLFAIFLLAGFLLFSLQRQHHDSYRPILENELELEEPEHERLNFTKELLSSTSFARQLSDQMTLGKAYIIIAKEHHNLQLAWEISSQIRTCQRLLSRAAVRGKSVTLDEAHPVITKLAQLIYKAQDSHYDISTTITTLKSHSLALEERASAAIVQSAEFGQMASAAVPKSLHCLSIKLTEEWFRNPAHRKLSDEHKNSPRLVDNNLYHFCIFSDNVLATSVVINSTVANADHPQQLVFHVVTDGVNYPAMSTWFLMNDFRGSTIEVRSIEEFSWFTASYSPVVKQLKEESSARFSTRSNGGPGEKRFNDLKYVTLLNHLRFYIPHIQPQLEKVVLLDDDVVVQKDLTPLFLVELHGNVIGAVETCLESYHRFHKYLNFSNPLISSKFDPQACGWAFGMNVIDLISWKKENITAKFHYWQEQNSDGTIWKAGTVPPGLLAFYGLVEPLDRRWHVLGLGYDPDIDDRLIESSAVVHYNGNLKPWLKLGVSRYKHLWEQYINFTHPFIRECITH